MSSYAHVATLILLVIIFIFFFLLFFFFAYTRYALFSIRLFSLFRFFFRHCFFATLTCCFSAMLFHMPLFIFRQLPSAAATAACRHFRSIFSPPMLFLRFLIFRHASPFVISMPLSAFAAAAAIFLSSLSPIRFSFSDYC